MRKKNSPKSFKPIFYFFLTLNYISKDYFAKKIIIPDTKIKKIKDLSRLRKIKIFFYSPLTASKKNSAGCRVVIIDILHDLKKLVKKNKLPWEIIFSNKYPSFEVDYLMLFKSLPPKNNIGNPKKILLICDEGENFYSHFSKFDSIVISSSIQFARLLSFWNKKETFFISEVESLKSYNFGVDSLKKKLPSKRSYNLMWHGSESSFSSLTKLKEIFCEISEKIKINILVVSGSALKTNYKWGQVNVTHYPWSVKNMHQCAKISKLGIIPARGSLRTTYLKPSSRVRTLFALGVPTLGDSKIPDVFLYNSQFKGFLASNKNEFKEKILYLLENQKYLDSLALRGIKLGIKKYSSLVSANQWINFFLNFEKNSTHNSKNNNII